MEDPPADHGTDDADGDVEQATHPLVGARHDARQPSRQAPDDQPEQQEAESFPACG
jgi:hypothetical protein